MDLKEKLVEPWSRSSSGNELAKRIVSDYSSFINFCPEQPQQKWKDPSILDYGIRIEQPYTDSNLPSGTQPSLPCDLNDQIKIFDQGQMNETNIPNRAQEWDASAMLNNLSFLEQKIHQLQDLVQSVVDHRSQVLEPQDELIAQQQQLISADLTSIIAQLISTAGSLLPSVKHNLSMIASIGQPGQPGEIVYPTVPGACGGVWPPNQGSGGLSDQSNPINLVGDHGIEHNYNVEEHEPKEEEDADEGENLPIGSYEILQLEKDEILAPHTHFCTICGKGFKRDANLRMHMRGHGDVYKTAAALAKPHKYSSSEPVLIKRYSCPFAGCKRNKDHKKFQPLKTILCIKNHYKRTHCDKSHICSRCNTKRFSVIADLKTHEKHCGKDKWLCSCGTTFSRKDKLFGHIALFQGHTPAIPLDEIKGSGGTSDRGEASDGTNKIGNFSFNLGSNAPNGSRVQNVIELKGSIDDPTNYFSAFNFDTCNFGGFPEFPRPPYEDSESSLSYIVSGSCNYAEKAGEAGPQVKFQKS